MTNFLYVGLFDFMSIGLRCFKKCLQEEPVFCSSVSAKFSISQEMRISVNCVAKVLKAKYSEECFGVSQCNTVGGPLPFLVPYT